MVVEGRCFSCGEPCYPDVLCSWCHEDRDHGWFERRREGDA